MESKRGIALITMLMIILVVSIIIVALSLYTSGFIARVNFFRNRRVAYQCGDTGADFYISFIPNTDVMRANFDTLLGANPHIKTYFILDSNRKVYEGDVSNGDKFLLWPIPFELPYKDYSTIYAGGEAWVYHFNSTGYLQNKYSRTFEMEVSFEMPFLSSGVMGHTMYK